MAQQALLTRDLANAAILRSINEAGDQALLSQIEGSQPARSLWADAAATSANLATGANVLGIQLGSAGSTVTIPGNLTVQGTTTTISTTNLTVSDALIYANDGGADPSFAGIAWDQGAALDVIQVYNPTDNRIELGRFNTVGGTVVPAAALTTLEDLRINSLSLAGPAIQGDGQLNVGSGAGGDLVFQAIGGGPIRFRTSSSDQWGIDGPTGDLYTVTNNNIGDAAQANSPSNVYAATSVVVGATTTITGNSITGSNTQASHTWSTEDAGGGNPSGALLIRGGDGDATFTQGADVSLLSGSAGTTGNAGNLLVQAGQGGPTSGAGGQLNMAAGDAPADGAGGSVSLSSGAGAGTGNGGNLALIAAQAGGTGTDGNITFQANGAAAFPYNAPGNLTPSSGASLVEAVNIALAGGATPTWAAVLASPGGNTSGATDPVISSGQVLRGEDIAGTAALDMRGGNSSGSTGGRIQILGGSGAAGFDGGDAQVVGGPSGANPGDSGGRAFVRAGVATGSGQAGVTEIYGRTLTLGTMAGAGVTPRWQLDPSGDLVALAGYDLGSTDNGATIQAPARVFSSQYMQVGADPGLGSAVRFGNIPGYVGIIAYNALLGFGAQDATRMQLTNSALEPSFQQGDGGLNLGSQTTRRWGAAYIANWVEVGGEASTGQVRAPNAVTADTAGGTLQVSAGAGLGTANGGGLQLNAGAGGPTGNGGSVVIEGGLAADGTTGQVILQTRNANNTNQAGQIDILVGNSSGATAGSNLNIAAGDAGGGGPQAGGLVEVRGGDSAAGAAGAVRIVGGTGVGTASTVEVRGGTSSDPAGQGGLVLISGGNGTGAGTDAGGLQLQAGVPTDGDGAGVTVAASSGVGTNRSGGSLILSAGAGTGSGTPGNVQLVSGTTTYPLTAAGVTGPALATTAQDIIGAINEVNTAASGTPSLANVLSLGGNTTGGTDIVVNFADRLRGQDGTAGFALTIRGGNGTTGNGAALTLQGGETNSGVTAGGVNIFGGQSTGASGSGGTIQIISGQGSSSSVPGNMVIASGLAVATNSQGGTITMTGGAGNGIGAGGGVTIRGGQGGGSGISASVGGRLSLGGGAPGGIGRTGLVDIVTGWATSAAITPPLLAAGDNDNYAPSGYDDAAVIRLRGDGAGTSVITGFQFDLESNWRRYTFINAGSDQITFENEGTGSNIANRFALGGANYVLPAGGTVEAIYDDNTNRWRLFTAGSGGGGGSSSSELTEVLTNGNVGAITLGQVVYLTTTNDTVDLANATANNAAAGAIAFVGDASIAAAASGNFVTGGKATVRLVGSLTVNPGDTIYLSTTAGSCTNVAPSTTGNVIQPVGKVKNTLSYDGATDFLVEILVQYGNRSIAP